jgi:hypothetical protein
MGILHGHALVVARRLHGPASVVWIILFGIHAVVYLKRALVSGGEEITPAGRSVRGQRARAQLIGSAVITGLVIAAATVPAQHRWVHLRRDHHHGDRTTATNIDHRFLSRAAAVTSAEQRYRGRPR